MHLISFINFADLELLDSGYTMSDQLASTVERYLTLFKIPYVSPFACIGIVPDNQEVSSLHPLNAFGDTALVLKPSLAEELRIACKSDIQNAASNGLAFWSRTRRVPSHLTVVNLDGVSNKWGYVQRLASFSTDQSYPEARLYRGLRWSDIDDECADRLRGQCLDVDFILGSDIR